MSTTKWIDVYNKMPKPNTLVLVYDEYFVSSDTHENNASYGRHRVPGVRFGWLSEYGDFHTEGVNGECGITHWRSLPRPPKGE